MGPCRLSMAALHSYFDVEIQGGKQFTPAGSES